MLLSLLFDLAYISSHFIEAVILAILAIHSTRTQQFKGTNYFPAIPLYTTAFTAMQNRQKYKCFLCCHPDSCHLSHSLWINMITINCHFCSCSLYFCHFPFEEVSLEEDEDVTKYNCFITIIVVPRNYQGRSGLWHIETYVFISLLCSHQYSCHLSQPLWSTSLICHSCYCSLYFCHIPFEERKMNVSIITTVSLPLSWFLEITRVEAGCDTLKQAGDLCVTACWHGTSLEL